MLLSKSAPARRPGLPPCHRTAFKCALLATIIALLGISCSTASQERAGTRERRVGANNQPPTNEKDVTNRKEMSDDENENARSRAPFYVALTKALAGRKLKLENVCDASDPVSRRVLEDYGAMFLASAEVTPPPVCMFTNEDEVLQFQERAHPTAAFIGGARIELQPAAMNALQAARAEARAAKLDITPRGGEEAARRGYDDTLRLWNTRFLPALAYWSNRGRLSKEQVARLKSLPLSDQVREVLELEKEGIFFSKDFSKSILYSIAAPGTSQHIAMLALDVDQFADSRVRQILARHGWFQTVKSDLPHFTYLGLDEKELSARGLRSVIVGKQLFWIPNVSQE